MNRIGEDNTRAQVSFREPSSSYVGALGELISSLGQVTLEGASLIFFPVEQERAIAESKVSEREELVELARKGGFKTLLKGSSLGGIDSLQDIMDNMMTTARMSPNKKLDLMDDGFDSTTGGLEEVRAERTSIQAVKKECEKSIWSLHRTLTRSLVVGVVYKRCLGLEISDSDFYRINALHNGSKEGFASFKKAIFQKIEEDLKKDPNRSYISILVSYVSCHIVYDITHFCTSGLIRKSLRAGFNKAVTIVNNLNDSRADHTAQTQLIENFTEFLRELNGKYKKAALDVRPGNRGSLDNRVGELLSEESRGATEKEFMMLLAEGLVKHLCGGGVIGWVPGKLARWLLDSSGVFDKLCSDLDQLEDHEAGRQTVNHLTNSCVVNICLGLEKSLLQAVPGEVPPPISAREKKTLKDLVTVLSQTIRYVNCPQADVSKVIEVIDNDKISNQDEKIDSLIHTLVQGSSDKIMQSITDFLTSESVFELMQKGVDTTSYSLLETAKPNNPDSGRTKEEQRREELNRRQKNRVDTENKLQYLLKKVLNHAIDTALEKTPVEGLLQRSPEAIELSRLAGYIQVFVDSYRLSLDYQKKTIAQEFIVYGYKKERELRQELSLPCPDEDRRDILRRTFEALKSVKKPAKNEESSTQSIEEPCIEQLQKKAWEEEKKSKQDTAKLALEIEAITERIRLLTSSAAGLSQSSSMFNKKIQELIEDKKLKKQELEKLIHSTRIGENRQALLDKAKQTADEGIGQTQTERESLNKEIIHVENIANKIINMLAFNASANNKREQLSLREQKKSLIKEILANDIGPLESIGSFYKTLDNRIKAAADDVKNQIIPGPQRDRAILKFQSLQGERLRKIVDSKDGLKELAQLVDKKLEFLKKTQTIMEIKEKKDKKSVEKWKGNVYKKYAKVAEILKKAENIEQISEKILSELKEFSTTLENNDIRKAAVDISRRIIVQDRVDGIIELLRKPFVLRSALRSVVNQIRNR